MPLLAIACGGDSSETANEGMQSQMPVSFSAGLAVSRQTRANITTENLWDGYVQVAVYDKNNTRVLPFRPNTTTTAEATTALLPVGSNFYWALNPEERHFTAWHPYASSDNDSPWTAERPLSVNVDQSTLTNSDYQSQDVLYAPEISFSYPNSGLLKFYHQLCRVVVNVTSTSTTNIVKEVKLGDNNIGVQGNITTPGFTGEMATGTTTVWGSVSGTSTITMRKNTDHSNDAGFYAVYECILPPQNGGSYDKALFTIKAEKNNVTKTYIYKDSYSFLPGYQYTYNLMLSKSGAVTIATVSVGNWGTVNFASGDADVPDDTH